MSREETFLWPNFSGRFSGSVRGLRTVLIVLGYSSLTSKLMVRVIHYFETQVKVPIITQEDEQAKKIEGATSNGNDSGSRVMRHREILPWFSKILEAVKMRYRKLQTFAR
jgi:mitogen-activated protein kinase kinase kinase